ncbi:MAG: hypothetical protein ABL962_10400 [Fimbriimonadaceae bacterium]
MLFLTADPHDDLPAEKTNMPLFFDTPGLRLDQGYQWDQVEDFPLKPDEVQAAPITPHSIKPRASKHRMNDRQRNQLQRLIRVINFGVTHAARFVNTPAKPGDAKWNAAQAELVLLRPQITAHQAVQASGGFSEATTNQAVERDELYALMQRVSRTAAPIAVEQNQPGIMDRFRMPSSRNDVSLPATGRAFADAITELSLASAFTDHGYEGNVVQDLLDEAQDITDAEGAQGGALSKQVGATESLPALLKKVRDHVKCQGTVIMNRFRNDPGFLGAWKTASHVTSTPSGLPPPPEPPAPPPP